MSDAIEIVANRWPTPPKADEKSLNRFYGGFRYEELSGGNVRIIGDWERDNIVLIKVKARGSKYKKVQVHRKISTMLEDLMEVIFETYPSYPIIQLGGFCARHKMHDPRRGLSPHSWGCAIDLNWDTNPVSKKLISDFPTGLPEIFEGAGWNWGGRWKGTKDAMHFQFTEGT